MVASLTEFVLHVPPAGHDRVPPLELRGAASAVHRNNAVLDVVAVRPRRRLLRGVVSKVCPLAHRLPFPKALVPADTAAAAAAAAATLRLSPALTRAAEATEE